MNRLLAWFARDLGVKPPSTRQAVWRLVEVVVVVTAVWAVASLLFAVIS
jgi:hypothetical protein